MKNFTRYRIIEIFRLFSDSILPMIFWVSLILGFDTPYVAILTIISAVVHEAGHCAAIRISTGKSASVKGHSSGFRIKRTESLPYQKVIFILLAGPMANVILYIITLPFGNALDGYLRVLGIVNLATGISNLMPLEGYDGYGAIKEALIFTGRSDAVKKLEISSFILNTILTFVALYLIERFGEGYWIFGLCFVMMLSKLVSFGKYDIFGE